MKLILFRHGLAVERDEFSATKKDDSLRPLIEKGRDKTKKMAKELKKLIPEIDLVVCSPYLRALQTAEILKESLKPRHFFETSDLVPTAPPQSFAQWLKMHSKDSLTVVAVGHEPQLSVFGSWLLTGQMESFFDLKKSGAVYLEIENFETIGPKTAELKWVITPKIFNH